MQESQLAQLKGSGQTTVASPPTTHTNTASTPTPERPRLGLQGWLIIAMILVVISLFGVAISSLFKPEPTFHLLQNIEVSGARCLDGSPGGFYFTKAATKRASKEWVFFFKGNSL